MRPTFSFLGMEIDSYLFMMVVGILLSFITILINNRCNKAYRLPLSDLFFLAIFILFGVLLGARFLFFLTMIPNMHSFQDVVKYAFKESGLVFYGGVIGGLLMGLLYVKLYGTDIQKVSDLFFSAIPIGHAIGRIGCYLAGCCYGRLVDAKHGVHFVTLEAGQYALPVQLYETYFLFAFFALLMILTYALPKRRPYFLSGIYFVGYGVWRFVIEFFRGDEIRGVALLSTSQWISIVIVILGLVLLFGRMERFSFFQKKKGWIYRKKTKEEK